MNPEPTRNLVIVHTPDLQARSDWETVKEKIGSRAPDIDVRIADNSLPNADLQAWQVSRPSLVVSVWPLMTYQPAGGTVYASGRLTKYAQFRLFSTAGVPMPETVPLRRGLSLDRKAWGEFVIVKPDGRGSSQGRHVRLVRTATLAARYAELTVGETLDMVVQKYVDSVDLAGRTCEYRVLMLLGRPIYTYRGVLVDPRPPLAAIADKLDGEIAFNRKGQKRHIRIVAHQDVIDLAARAAEAMRAMPCLAFDIARDRVTGRLSILEANSGDVWHLSSKTSQLYKPEFLAGLYAQFGALDVAAEALIERTRAEAS